LSTGKKNNIRTMDSRGGTDRFPSVQGSYLVDTAYVEAAHRACKLAVAIACVQGDVHACRASIKISRSHLSWSGRGGQTGEIQIDAEPTSPALRATLLCEEGNVPPAYQGDFLGEIRISEFQISDLGFAMQDSSNFKISCVGSMQAGLKGHVVA
jgi:hypothetical protein